MAVRPLLRRLRLPPPLHLLDLRLQRLPRRLLLLPLRPPRPGLPSGVRVFHLGRRGRRGERLPADARGVPPEEPVPAAHWGGGEGRGEAEAGRAGSVGGRD